MAKSEIKEGMLFVSRSIFNRRTKEETGEVAEEKLEVREFLTASATVEVLGERVWNLDNFESLRIRVGFTIPCYAEEVGEVQKELATRLPARIHRAAKTFCEKTGIELEGVTE